jgi:hypothetical protein
LQTQNVEHIEQTVGLVRQKTHRTQTALGVGGAAGGFMGDFDALAGACEQNRMVAHDIATADGGKTDAGWIALAGDAFAGEYPSSG